MTNLVNVHLHGPLADKFGAHHAFAIRTPAEAVHALDANYPGFIAAFVAHERYGIVADDDVRDDVSIGYPVSREIHFVPVIEGRYFIGPAIIGSLLGIGAATATAQILGGLLMAGLMMGLSMLLTPRPKAKDETKKDESYSFTGPENTTGQGVAVPLCYGRVFCGSVVISAGLEIGSDIAPASNIAAPPPGGGSSAVAPGLPPPPGGFPPIVPHEGFPLQATVMDARGRAVITDDVEGGPHPEGWVMTNQMTVATEGNIGVTPVEKRVWIYQPDPQPDPTGELVYSWNERQGFYALVKVQVEEEEWVDAE